MVLALWTDQIYSWGPPLSDPVLLDVKSPKTLGVASVPEIQGEHNGKTDVKTDRCEDRQMQGRTYGQAHRHTSIQITDLPTLMCRCEDILYGRAD